MKKTRQIGKEYEEKALDLLFKNNFSEVACNYYSKWGEIDLIVKKDKLLLFVEVKYRKRENYGRGYEAVDRKKQKRIYLTALDFLQKNNFNDFSFRFDIISFDGKGHEWIKNCFWGDELGF